MALVALTNKELVMKTKVLYDRRKSIYLFILLFITYAIIYMTKNCYSAAMASIVQAGIMTKSDTGLIASMFYATYAPFQIIGGIAVDKYSPYKLIFIGLLGAGIANLLIYLAEGYIWMLIIWTLNGVVQFGVWPGIFKIVTTELMPEHRSNAILFINMSVTAGLVLSYVCAAFISNWKNNFLFSAVMLFALSAVFLIIYKVLSRFMTEDVSESKLKPQESDAVPPQKTAARDKIAVMVKAGIPFILIISLIHSLLNLGIKALAPVMLMESYASIDASLANILNILLIIAGPVGLFASHAPCFRFASPTKSMSIMLVLLLPGVAVIAFIGKISAVFIIAAMTLVMIITGAMTVLFFEIARGFVKYDCVGTLTGTINGMGAVGILLANYVFSRLAELRGWQFTALVWLALSAFALLLSLASIPFWSRFKKSLRD